MTNTDAEGGDARTALRVILGLALLTPTCLCCVGGLLIPTIGTAITSMQDLTLFQLGTGKFVGFSNYTRLFQDQAFSGAWGFTLSLIRVRLLVVVLLPLLLALLVNEFGRWVRALVRLLFTIPLALFAPTAMALAWLMTLDPHVGLINLAEWLGGQRQSWLSDPESARQVLVMIDGLTIFGLACGVGLIFYLAALRGSGEEAPSWKTIWKPLVACWFIGGLATIALALQSFTLSYVVTRGGPLLATMTLVLHQFRQGIQTMNIGLASAVATLTLLPLMLLGLIVGLVIVLTRLRLEMVPGGKRSDIITAGGRGRPIVFAGLLVVLLIALGGCLFSITPLLGTALTSFRGEAEMLGHPQALFSSSPTLAAYVQLLDQIPFIQVLVNTVLPPLLGVLLIQIPIAYLGALAIGAVRPFKKWSELLLLPFCPWLFVTISSLSMAFLVVVTKMGLSNTWIALVFPLIFSVVPTLFMLTLFFKGQEPKWRTAIAEGRSSAQAFVNKMVLPSLPLTLLLACAGFLVGLQELLWPTVAARYAQLPAHAALLSLLVTSPAPIWPMLSAGIVLFGLPPFLLFLLVLGLLQIFYLDRLALVVAPADTTVEESEPYPGIEEIQDEEQPTV